MIDSDLHVWLAYTADPQTTGAYLERTFRKICRVTTLGPSVQESLLEKLNLKAPELTFGSQEVPTGLHPDMKQILDSRPKDQHPDLFIWVESMLSFRPCNLEALTCTKICYLIDSHINLENHLKWCSHFDYVFVVHLNQLAAIRNVNKRSFWLPVACDPSVHCKRGSKKQHDISFVGSYYNNPARETLINRLKRELPLHTERCFLEKMADVFSASRIVLNQARDNDLNMRFFEALSTGSLLLSDYARNSGQDILFRDGEEYACYTNENVVDLARFYLENEALREQIAARGRLLVHNAHTYEHRVHDMLDVVLNGKRDTFSPSELRERSLVEVPEPYCVARKSVLANNNSRSFVIPVLDYSPASEYSIHTLLEDLEQISGEVIVIFNSESVAQEMKGHPRIDHYAVMKRNVGVSRVWNIGIDIAETPTVFIVNADAHVSVEAVDCMEKALKTLEGAGCVGPQGSFVNFSLCRDYHYFDKGSFNTALEVDAVSGFFFAVKRELFENKTLLFENAYTPCYFEEWDLGLQIRKAGYKCYVVPTTSYDHHWSGTIRALRTIPYMGREETSEKILNRNRLLFVSKWRELVRLENCASLLDGGWKAYALGKVEHLISSGEYQNAATILRNLTHDFPEDPAITSLNRFISLHTGKMNINKGIL